MITRILLLVKILMMTTIQDQGFSAVVSDGGGWR